MGKMTQAHCGRACEMGNIRGYLGKTLNATGVSTKGVFLKS